MEYLKEDGSLDVERINKLPREEYMREIGRLSPKRYEEYIREYISKLPLKESRNPMKVVVVDYTLEELLERGAVIAEDFINNLRSRHILK